MLGGKNNLNLFNSFFVSSKDGLHLIFSRKEHLIAKFVYLVVVEVLLDKYGDSKNFQSDTTKVRKKLKSLQDLLDTTNKERIKMQDIFTKWTAVRKRNITEMREVTDFIDLHKCNRKISLLLGSSLVITGGK
ncbi:hypothetical protein TNIN_320121 [Trichonephila inaurata madagascariensis]|uniref:Uncharacterized protein n=1 Tax=Trichonephila inaurata madagascariensis TaxID=2747483 RepID=A0A8X6XFT2_9ARAC|nr:hypothetical protein TNIN_320121 [Trichonephila inaurata madagascariensis]